jgi:tight adherence protein B
MDPVFIKLATFVAAAFAVVAMFSIISDLVLREKSRIRDRFRDEFGSKSTHGARRSDLLKDLKQLRAEASRPIPAIVRQFLTMVEQSGLDTTPGRILQIAFTAAIVGGVVGTAVSWNAIVGAVLTLVGFAAPFVYVHAKHKERVDSLRSQLPEAFDLMSRAVKAGQTLQGAMHIAASQLKPPLAAEFGACCDQQNFGLPQDVALQELARRSGVMELQMFVVAMLVHRTSGGNPVAILENLSDVIRKRTRLLGKVKAATSEGRLQAVVLSVLPLGALLALWILNRPYAQILFDRPLVLSAVLVSEAVGALWIRRIVRFDY